MLARPGRPVKGARVLGQELHDLVSSGAATTAGPGAPTPLSAPSWQVPGSGQRQELAFMLGFRDGGAGQFTGPARGSGAEPDLLHRACWGLALLTEVYRRGPAVAAAGPIGRLRDRSARSLLDAAPDAGLGQLAALRKVMESVLLPGIASRQGLWAIGPVFAGSQIMPGDADLVAGGLLTELKTTSKKPSLGVTDLWQVLGYVLMDYADEFAITDVALFSARYGYLAQWNLDVLLPQLAGRPVTTAQLRAEFWALLESCRGDG
jgi:hypothetical protein